MHTPGPKPRRLRALYWALIVLYLAWSGLAIASFFGFSLVADDATTSEGLQQ
jgi:hypothetical protein